MTNSEFVSFWDPATQHELIMDGKLGTMLSCTVYTDGFREPKLKVLEPGEVFFFASPDSIGTLFQRSPIQSHEINMFSIGVAVQGFFIRQAQAMGVFGHRGIARGYRL